VCAGVSQIDSLRGGAVYGVTLLNTKLYVLRERMLDHAEWFMLDVYFVKNDSWQLEKTVTVSGEDLRDLASCVRNRCLYVCDFGTRSIRKLSLDGEEVSSWPVIEACIGISVISGSCNLLLTSGESNMILELSSERGECLHHIQLPEEIESPRHAFQLSSGEFLVSHGDVGEHSVEIHRVCKVRSDGSRSTIIQSFGSEVDSAIEKLSVPCQIAVDKDGFVFVTDCWNNRLVLLSLSLKFIREIKDLGDCPRRLCLDHVHRMKVRLYVGLEDKLTIVEL